MNHDALRTGLALVAIFSATGCTLAGERVGGVCPAGETCSDQAPDGLFFLGARRADGFDEGVSMTAAGGTQTIKVLLGSNTDSPSFDKTFDAVTSEVKVATISSIAPPNLVVSAGVEGTTSVRLLEKGTTKLLDRITLHVAAIDKVTVFPRELFLIAPDDGKPWAMLAGGKAPMIMQLKAESGDRLVDETLTVTSESGPTTKQAWDVFDITAPTKGNASITVIAGASKFDATATVVTAIDEIAVAPLFGSVPEGGNVEASTDAQVCFVSKAAGVPTTGATWTFTGSPTITFPPADNDVMVLPNCVQIRGAQVGPAKLTVEASGISKVIELNFVKKASRRAPGVQSGGATGTLRAASAGERASGH